MIRICTQIKYDDDDDDDDDDDVRGTGSPPKVNQFFRLMGPVITTMITVIRLTGYRKLR